MERTAFSPEELKPISGIASPFPGQPDVPVYNSPITPMENLRLLLSGEKPLWMHSMADCTMISPTVVPDNVARGMIVENKPFDISNAGGADMFGVEWEYIPQVMGSMVRPGKPTVPDINEWENYITFPDISKWDWAASAELNKDFCPAGIPLLTSTMTGLFERLISFLDMENAFYALADTDQHEGVHRLFDKLCDLYDNLFGYLRKYLNIDIVNFHDDWGSQRAPFFSLDTCMEILVPYLKRVVDSAHKHGIIFDLHSCGKNELLVPAMIEAGVDSWWGQPMNDKEKLYKLYGDKIVLGVDLDVTPESTDEDVHAAVDKLMKAFPEGNVYVGMYQGPQSVREVLYTTSRKMLGS